MQEMNIKTWSVLALAISAGVSQMALAESVTDQSQATGFLEGSTLNGLLRNEYFNRNRENGRKDNIDWTQAAMANYSSGFTQGTIGFGVDAYAFGAVKLDATNATANTGNLPVNRNGEPEDAYGSSGGDIKIRVSKTELKYGQMQPSAPVFAVSNTYLLPETATGFDLTSSEFKGLDLEVGHFTSTNSAISTDHDHDIHTTYSNITASSASFVGGKYQITPNWSATLYGGEFTDIWRQYYANSNYTWALGGTQSLNVDGNLYRTLSEGAEKAGTINNTTYSLAAAYSFLSAHKLTLSYQKVHGDTPFDYASTGDNGAGSAGGSIFLANSVQWSDFNGPGEQSWGIRYDLDLATYGVPGLSFMTRYINGKDINGTNAPANSAYLGEYGADGKHHETDVEAKYVIQGGPAKNLSFRLRQAFVNSNASQGEGDLTETRLIIDYPFSIL